MTISYQHSHRFFELTLNILIHHVQLKQIYEVYKYFSDVTCILFPQSIFIDYQHKLYFLQLLENAFQIKWNCQLSHRILYAHVASCINKANTFIFIYWFWTSMRKTCLGEVVFPLSDVLLHNKLKVRANPPNFLLRFAESPIQKHRLAFLDGSKGDNSPFANFGYAGQSFINDCHKIFWFKHDLIYSMIMRLYILLQENIII